MYGDPSHIKRRTDELRDQGGELEQLAQRLVARTAAVRWHGRASDALHERIGERAAALRGVATRHEAAADALAAHGEAVEELKERIAAAEARYRRLADEAPLDDFEPPPPGHREWLTVQLPAR